MNTFLKNKSRNLGITFPSKIYFEKYLVSKVHPSPDLKNIDNPVMDLIVIRHRMLVYIQKTCLSDQRVIL